ncbi:MAG TPA: AAA family ATPase [archaeon]|nr:AAA family ATPase [archaeon]
MPGKNLFKKSAQEKSVFKDERFLYPEYIPEALPHREKEINSLVYCFDPITKGKKPMNVFLTGPTGVGKTVCAKYVLHELEESFDRTKTLYLNCFEYNSRPAVLTAIANFVGASLPRRGLATDEIFSKMLEFMKKCGFTPIVILDEVDQLLISEANSKLLYDLIRIVEYEKQGIGIVLISNDISLTSKLDSRIRSSLAEQTIVFDSYTPEQLKKILKARCELAFEANAFESDVVNVAAAHAAKLGGDCRVAIESLLKAGRIAERENTGIVSVETLQKAFEAVDMVSLLKGLPHLAKDDVLLLKIIAENQPINSGKIYELYSSREGAELKERRLREILTELEKKNFINAKLVSMGNKGKTKEFSSRIPKQSLLSEIAKIK